MVVAQSNRGGCGGGGKKEGGQEEFFVDSAFKPLHLTPLGGLLLHP